MHTSSSEIAEIQLPKAGRRHARYSDDFKRQVVAACLEPGVSKAGVTGLVHEYMHNRGVCRRPWQGPEVNLKNSEIPQSKSQDR